MTVFSILSWVLMLFIIVLIAFSVYMMFELILLVEEHFNIIIINDKYSLFYCVMIASILTSLIHIYLNSK